MISRFRLFALMVLVAACGNQQERIQPEYRPIVESVYASVKVQPDSLYRAFALVQGMVEANLVEEGQEVMPDQPLVKLINTNPELQAQTALLNYELAREQYQGQSTVLKSIEQEIETARLQFVNDSVNYCRQKNLWDQGIGSKVEFDTRKLAYERSANAVNLLKDRYAQTSTELQTRLRVAENAYQSSLKSSSDFTVRSMIQGKVYALYTEKGEVVNPQQPLALLGSSNDFVLEMLVDEVDIVRIGHKQEVVITLDAYPQEIFNAYVTKIYPTKDERNQTFVVEARFLEPPEVLYPGLAGEANIVIARRDSVLTIPRAYLLAGNRVLTEDGERNVELGLTNLDHVEIVSGISPETVLLKPSR